MDPGVVMQAVADRVDTIPGLRVQAFPAETVSPPAAVVTYPAVLTLDGAYRRGMDRMDPQVVVLVGNVYKKSTRDLISEYAAGSGPKSIKAVLESGSYNFALRVVQIEFEAVTIGAVEYLAARFTLDIAGQGA